MVIPGNHDALVPGAWEEGAAAWRPFWQGDDTAAAQDVAHAFPTLRRRGPLALVGVSSAIASAPGLAVGAVGEDQLHRLAALLRRTRGEGLCRVVLVHHPPLDGTVRARKRLTDAAALRAVLERDGVELVLHGHSHRSHHQILQTRAGPARGFLGLVDASRSGGLAPLSHRARPGGMADRAARPAPRGGWGDGDQPRHQPPHPAGARAMTTLLRLLGAPGAGELTFAGSRAIPMHRERPLPRRLTKGRPCA